MDDQDRSRFIANVEWFNQFFLGLRQLYEIAVDSLPIEYFPNDFALKSTNFYFPRQNFAPSIPDYYVLMIGGKQFALQVVAVFNPALFGKPDLFAVEPSIVVVLHSQLDSYNYIEDYALRVIGNRGIEITQQADSKFWGKINAKLPADFFSFQVTFDKFPADQNSHGAVRRHIVDPITEHLEKSYSQA